MAFELKVVLESGAANAGWLLDNSLAPHVWVGEASG